MLDKFLKIMMMSTLMLVACGDDDSPTTVIESCQVKQTEEGAVFECPNGQTAVVKNGRDGANAQGRATFVTKYTELDNAQCKGFLLEIGPDDDLDGQIDEQRKQSSTFCSGQPGRDGFDSLFNQRRVPVGQVCPSGGDVVDFALDKNANGQIDDGELVEVFAFCDVTCAVDEYFDEVGQRCRAGRVFEVQAVISNIGLLSNAMPYPGDIEVGTPAIVRIAMPLDTSGGLIGVDVQIAGMSIYLAPSDDARMLLTSDPSQGDAFDLYTVSPSIETPANFPAIRQFNVTFFTLYRAAFPDINMPEVPSIFELGLFQRGWINLRSDAQSLLLSFDPSKIQPISYFKARGMP